MSLAGLTGPQIAGGIVQSPVALPTSTIGEKQPLIIDNTTGALIVSLATSQTAQMVQGLSADQTNYTGNPIVVAGVEQGDSPTTAAIAAQSVGGVACLAVTMLNSPTVSVSGTVYSREQGNPGVSGDKATATAGTATITYAAGSGSVCNYISSVHQSYSGSATLPTALAPGTLTINDGATALVSIDVTAAGPNSFYFDPPIQGTAATAMTVTLSSGGTAVVGKINARHYQQ